MKVLVLGGDGFCGWPTSLHLSDLATTSPLLTTSVAEKSTSSSKLSRSRRSDPWASACGCGRN